MGNVGWNFSICTVPFPFYGGDGIRQRNAIRSWLMLKPQPEIILIGDDEGVPEFAQEHNLRHVGIVKRNKLGDMSCSDILRKCQNMATYDDILYMDCDVILLPNFTRVLRYVSQKYKKYMLVSGRWNMPTPQHDLQFNDGWEERMVARIIRHHEHGTDFHGFNKGLIKVSQMPDFSIGAGAWDGWMMWHALNQGAELVRCDHVTKALHQKHARRWTKRPGKPRNVGMAGGHRKWVVDATVVLKPEEID